MKVPSTTTILLLVLWQVIACDAFQSRVLRTSSVHTTIRYHNWRTSSMSSASSSLIVRTAASDDAAVPETETASSEAPTEDATTTTPSTAVNAAAVVEVPLSKWQRLRGYLGLGDEYDENGQKLTFRQKVTKMGLAAGLSYGFVSNMSYCVSMGCAWYIFSKRTGLSPLAPGQWKGYLAVYTGFWVFNNIVRPLRLALSVAVSPQFERLVEWNQAKFGVSKGVAVTMTIITLNLFGTLGFLAVCVGIASTLAGVPVFATT